MAETEGERLPFSALETHTAVEVAALLNACSRAQAYAAVDADRKKKREKKHSVLTQIQCLYTQILGRFLLSSSPSSSHVCFLFFFTIPPIKTEEISVAPNFAITVLHRERTRHPFFSCKLPRGTFSEIWKMETFKSSLKQNKPKKKNKS